MRLLVVCLLSIWVAVAAGSRVAVSPAHAGGVDDVSDPEDWVYESIYRDGALQVERLYNLTFDWPVPDEFPFFRFFLKRSSVA
jgi:hypothetical protein